MKILKIITHVCAVVTFIILLGSGVWTFSSINTANEVNNLNISNSVNKLIDTVTNNSIGIAVNANDIVYLKKSSK